MSKLLEGVRVLDLTQAYSGPFATMQLADHGAEIIKVEPPYGDQARTWPPFKNNYSGYYASINRNKKGIALDLKNQKGAEVLRRLIGNCDVLCENFRPGVMEKLGFSYDAIQRINPQIIYARLSGYGDEGEYVSRPAYDAVIQAVSGLADRNGFASGPPTKIGISIVDSFSGAYLAMGICMALYRRTFTGEGEYINVSMLDTAFSLHEGGVVDYTLNGNSTHRLGNSDSYNAPFGIFRAGNGYFALCIATDTQWKKFCAAIGNATIADLPDYQDNERRVANTEKVTEIVETWSLVKSVEEVEDILTSAGVACGRVMDISEITNHPKIAARNMLWSVYDPGFQEEIRIPGTPIKADSEDDMPSKASPLLGENTKEILQQYAGYSEKEIEDLCKNGICYALDDMGQGDLGGRV